MTTRFWFVASCNIVKVLYSTRVENAFFWEEKNLFLSMSTRHEYSSREAQFLRAGYPVCMSREGSEAVTSGGIPDF